LCSGLARRPLKAVARVRIPSGLRRPAPVVSAGAGAICGTGFSRFNGFGWMWRVGAADGFGQSGGGGEDCVQSAM
jgi:hypothetical protein